MAMSAFIMILASKSASMLPLSTLYAVSCCTPDNYLNGEELTLIFNLVVKISCDVL